MGKGGGGGECFIVIILRRKNLRIYRNMNSSFNIISLHFNSSFSFGAFHFHGTCQIKNVEDNGNKINDHKKVPTCEVCYLIDLSCGRPHMYKFCRSTS